MIPRSQDKEMLDAMTPPIGELRKAMHHIAWTNRVFLNNWLIGCYVKKLIGHASKASVLDIGTGIADIPKYLVQKLNKKDRVVIATGIDIDQQVLTLAREYVEDTPSVTIIEKPLKEIADNQFTVAVMSQMLHHLTPEEAVAMLRTAHTKVTNGIIISDFIRSRFNYYLAKWSIALTFGSKFNKSDGPLSILRSYTDSEIKHMLHQAGINKYKIKNYLLRKIVIIYK
jgi:2-polyprenyl-3-methyl-5-hydroxy-6-metoxy-1,4-benzoquinol methylase